MANIGVIIAKKILAFAASYDPLAPPSPHALVAPPPEPPPAFRIAISPELFMKRSDSSMLAPNMLLALFPYLVAATPAGRDGSSGRKQIHELALRLADAVHSCSPMPNVPAFPAIGLAWTQSVALPITLFTFSSFALADSPSCWPMFMFKFSNQPKTVSTLEFSVVSVSVVRL